MKKKREKKNLYIFLIISFIFVLLLVLLPKFLYGRNLLAYYIQPIKKYGSLYGNFDNTYLMSSSLNYRFMWGRFLSFIIIIFFLLFIWWTKKNIKYERKIIYPIMYFIFVMLIYFTYLGYSMTWIGSPSSDILIAPINNLFLSGLLIRMLFMPIDPLNFIFIILIKVGDMVDCKFRNRNYMSSMKLFYIGSVIFALQFLICVILSFMYGG